MHGLRAAARVVTAALLLASCSGTSGDPADGTSDAPVSLCGAEKLIGDSWAVKVASDEVRAPFESNGGWTSLVMKRDAKSAVASFGEGGGLATAHAHMDAAALYREAALASGNAIQQVYGETPQETDPVEVAHLLVVSEVLVGDLDGARTEAAKLADVPEGDWSKWHAPWKAWLASDDPQWPPDLSGLPVELGEPAPGSWPGPGALPHYKLQERAGSEYAVEVADPSALVALALWHEAAAKKAAPEAEAGIEIVGARHRLPIEPPVAGAEVDLPMDLLFGSEALVSADASFVADLRGPSGTAAVETWKDRSIAAAIASCATKDGSLDHQKGLEVVADMRESMLREMEKVSGSEQAYHRIFADVGSVSTLWTLALVAEVGGDRETSGSLRMNARDLSTAAAESPPSMLSFVAWDASNRFPTRGTEIVHNLIRRYPSLETARFGLDVLALRVSRERGPQLPGN